MKTSFAFCSFAAAILTCATLAAAEKEPPEMTALFTAQPIVVDGILNEEIWEQTNTYQMDVPASINAAYGMQEPGEVKLAWDTDYLYVGVSVKDSDIYATGKEDQEMHFLLGDVIEVFLKPAQETFYWEMYVTPKSLKTSLFLPGTRILFGDYKLIPQLPTMKGAAKVDGTINKWQDTDTSWSCEFAIPRQDLEKSGAQFNPDQDWRIQICRYNYSRTLSDIEYSSAPKLSAINFHLLEEFAKLKLVK